MQLPDIKKNRSVQSKTARCRLVTLLSFTVFLVSACSTPGESSNARLQADAKGDSLLIVDCLLPGQVRQLTSRTRHVTSKRPIKTSGQDCSNRGGEFTVFDRADYATALKVWLARAVDGDAEAQNYVGEIYEKGLGVDPDYKTAAEWYERAAQQEFSRSYINLANLYEKGLGVERDAVRAMNLYRRASGIDWEELGYASSFVSVSQIQATITSRQEEVSDLKREQQSFQESLQATKARLAREKARETARIADNNRTDNNRKVASPQSGKGQTSTDTKQAVPFFPPEILIYDPAITLTRGGATVLMDSQAEFINVVGKISASEGVSEAYLNGERLKTDEFDLFFTIMPVTKLPENVKIFAADRQQNSTEFEFTVQSISPEMMASSYQREAPEAGDSALGSYHALVIGNSEYGSFPKHPAGAANAVEVKTLLEEKYGVNSTLLLNATRYQVLFAINELRDRLQAKDNLLIYYAGRCEADQSNRPAYWLPVDAEPQDNSRWISNVAVSDLLNTVQSNRVMVVSDSCYAGTFTTAAIPRTAVPEGTRGYRQWVESMKDVRARTVLASGAAQSQLLPERVEQSFFTKTFLDVLGKNEQIIDGNSVYVEMLKTMAQSESIKSAGNAPTYEAIKYAGHEAGEFFFRPLI